MPHFFPTACGFYLSSSASAWLTAWVSGWFVPTVSARLEVCVAIQVCRLVEQALRCDCPSKARACHQRPGMPRAERPRLPFEDVPEVRFGLPVLSLSVKSFSDQATRQERMGMVWSAYPEFVLKKFSKIVASFLVSPLPSYGSSQLITGIQHIGVVVIGHFKPVLQQRAKVVLGLDTPPLIVKVGGKVLADQQSEVMLVTDHLT